MKITVDVKKNDAWEKAMEKVQTLGGVKGVKVGIFEDAKTPDGESIAFYAACNEFGTKDIPSRPFMRLTAQRNMNKWAAIFKNVTQDKIIENPDVARCAFWRIGRQAQSDMSDTILSNIPPPNADAYREWKESKPGREARNGNLAYAGTLVYTGNMRESIDYRLTDKNGNELPTK